MWRSRVTAPACTTHRPARKSSAPGSSTSPSGSMPIRPTPRTVNPTWCATSHSMAAVRSTPPSPLPMPTCGAVIHPIAVRVTRTARPLAAAAQAAMPPVTTSGRAGRPPAPGFPLDPGAEAGRACSETATHPILTTPARRPKQARRTGLAPHDVADQSGGLAGRLADADAGLLQRFLLGLGGTGGARDDRAGVPHRLALRRGEPGHVPHDRLGHVLLDEGSGALLGVAADLADHHDGVGLRVLLEGLQAVDVRGPDHRVAADPDRGGEPDVAQFVHHLVGQRARRS